MASVLFSTIGQAVGGPLGAVVGAGLGSAVDGALFAPRANGQDLQISRSAYGEILPRLFGRMRVAGHLIWALPMETGGSKGSGRRAAGTSFAFAISSGPILDIGRIWADGREIRDAEGRFETATTMRIHPAGSGEGADPLISAAESAGFAPDYRGISYVVFENFGLGPFGNRIPNLSFEVVADEEGASRWLSEMGAAVGSSDWTSSEERLVDGFAVASGRLADDADTLAKMTSAVQVLHEGRFGYRAEARCFAIGIDELLPVDSAEYSTLSISGRPAALNLGYCDLERDYQSGRQRVARGRMGAELESGGALAASASNARIMAERLLKRAEAGSELLTFNLPWRWLHLSIGDEVCFDGTVKWSIVKREIRSLQLRVEALRVPSIIAVPGSSDAGRPLPAPLIPAGPTMLHAFETPVPLMPGGAHIWVAATGSGKWRGAEIRHLIGGDERTLTAVRAPSAYGTLLAPFEPASEHVWDERNSLLIKVLQGADGFETRSESAVLAGANLLIVGAELLQFQNAEFVSEDVVRLSRLIRGRFGTAYRMARAESGDMVLQLGLSDLGRLPLAVGDIGRESVFLGIGAGDPVGGTELVYTARGDGTSVMGPVHLSYVQADDGAIRFSWIPRSVQNWEWTAAESMGDNFLLHYESAAGERLNISVSGTEIELSVAEQIMHFGSVLPPGQWAVEAVGDGPLALRISSYVQV